MLTTEIRLVIQSEGMKVMNDIVKNQKDNFLASILNRSINRIDLKSIIYFAWDYATESEVNLINEILKELEKQDYSYSVSMSKAFKWLDMNYMNTKKYMLVPYAKSAKNFENCGAALYNYLKYADEMNIKEA